MKRLPHAVFDFIDGGAEGEVSLRHNRAVFDRVRFRARTVVDISVRSLATEVFGKPLGAPFGIAPMGGLGLFHSDAEIHLARAAAKVGIPYGLSTGSNTSIERLAEAAPDCRLWFQLYTFRDPRINRSLVQRAQAAGYEALIVTTDTHVFPKRERDRRNGFSLSMNRSPKAIANVVAHPRWLWDVVLRRGMPRMESLVREVEGPADYKTLTNFFLSQRNSQFDWYTVRGLRDLWRGPFILKGIMHVDEAVRAADAGVDGIILSNHGGRNLESAVAPLEILPEVVDAVGRRLAVMLDSGFRRGTDIVKAIALGAKLAFIGRPAAYAVAAGGEAGAERVVDILRDEVDRTMAYLGCPTIDKLGRDCLWFDGLAESRSNL
jgi:isopentenyl diphosphate isomerase/L-lactate dehydrogenase-like FMN-dependent dehydrogenase